MITAGDARTLSTGWASPPCEWRGSARSACARAQRSGLPRVRAVRRVARILLGSSYVEPSLHRHVSVGLGSDEAGAVTVVANRDLRGGEQLDPRLLSCHGFLGEYSGPILIVLGLVTESGVEPWRM